MMCAADDPVMLLGEWATRRPQDFSGESAMCAVVWLLEHANQVRNVETQYRAHRTFWERLPVEARLVAGRRQVAALAARLAMRNGMERADAITWVIAIAGMTRRDFKLACDDALCNGDRLRVWQWRELRELGLRDAFMSRRQIELWLELEEPWLFDDRWVFPLHLVDKDILAQFGAPPSLTFSPESNDGTA